MSPIPALRSPSLMSDEDDSPADGDLSAPPGGWRVRILDRSATPDDNVTEEVGGFATLRHANAFVRRYVRDSVEHCRQLGLSTKDVLSAWFAYGEDAVAAATPALLALVHG